MKKILAIAFIISAFSSYTHAQTLRASIGPADIASKVRVYVQSSAPVPMTNISTLQFNLAISDAINPKPTIVVYPNNTNFPGVTWQVNTISEGGYYHYTLTTPVAPIIVSSLNTTNEVAALDVEFFGGPAGTYNVSLVSMPGGGSNEQLVFYCTGNPSSDGTSLYYSRSGTIITNGNTYTGPDVSTAVISNISLPVKFLSFFALKNGDDAKLNWTVASDENNRYFEIERSTDGRVFKTIGKVDAMGNGKSVNTYETVDAGISKLGANIVYYRIKQTDKNGELTYSNVKNLNNVKKSTPVQLFPNPVKNVTKVVVDADAAGKGSIIIRDVTGKMVRQINTQFVKGINQQDINVSDLASGDYNVQVIGDGFSYLLKLSKIN